MSDRSELERVTDQYNNEAELQVISLSAVVDALRSAMEKMRGVVSVLAATLMLMGAVVLVNSSLLRLLSEHKRMVVLHAIGFPGRFVYGAALIENLALVFIGTVVGLIGAPVLGRISTQVLTNYLPYDPSGDLVAISAPLALGVLCGSLLLGVLATLPAVFRLRFFSDLSALRGE